MSTIKFRRITEYGSLSASGRNPQFNLVDWNGYEKYDIRRWDDTNTQPYKGITFDEEELEELLGTKGKSKLSKDYEDAIKSMYEDDEEEESK